MGPEKASSFSFLSTSVERRGVTVPQIHSSTLLLRSQFPFQCSATVKLSDLNFLGSTDCRFYALTIFIFRFSD